MSFLLNRSRKKSDGLPQWAILDQEALRIGAAMEHLQEHGNLDSFPGSQKEKLALMMTASRQRLVKWNRKVGRYELISLGRERSGMGDALRKSDGPMKPLRASASSGKGWMLGSGPIMAGIVGMAIGAAATASLIGISSKQLPREQALATNPSPTAKGTEISGSGNVSAQAQAPAPAQELTSVARNVPASASAGQKLEPPKAEQQQPEAHPLQKPGAQQPAAHPGAAGAVMAQQLALASAWPAPTFTIADNEATTADDEPTEAKPPSEPAPAAAIAAEKGTSESAPATSAAEAEPAAEPNQQLPRRDAERAPEDEPTPATSAPSLARTEPAGESNQQPPRRGTERVRTHDAAPANPEQSSHAQSTGEASARNAGKTSKGAAGNASRRTGAEMPGHSANKPSRSQHAEAEARGDSKSHRIIDWLFR